MNGDSSSDVMYQPSTSMQMTAAAVSQ